MPTAEDKFGELMRECALKIADSPGYTTDKYWKHCDWYKSDISVGVEQALLSKPYNIPEHQIMRIITIADTL